MFPSLKHITKFALVLDFAEIMERINIASLLESWRPIGAPLSSYKLKVFQFMLSFQWVRPCLPRVKT